MKKQFVPLVFLVLLVLASIFRYNSAGMLDGKTPLKTDRWTGVTWMMYPEKEEPITDAPEHAEQTRNTLTYAWLVITVGTLVWAVLLKAKKES
ncbi:MAG: hypothetical protein ACYCX4_12155 [Bacillota bacterium]